MFSLIQIERRTMKKISLISILLFFLFASVSYAGEPILTISTRNGEKSWTTSNLLKRSDVETVTIKSDPAYPNREMKYKAIPVAHLFEGIEIPDDVVIQFKALDGFSAPLSKARLLNTSDAQSKAYVAVEPLQKKWPSLKPGKPSAGPFYLVWKNPELSNIGTEEWPFMLAAFEVKESLEKVFPKIFPAPEIKKDDSIYKGLNVFVKNCFACHTLNKSGSATLGPDLNQPMNPTEYLTTANLKKLIRNPQNLRHWPNSRMTGFSESALNETDLNHLIDYLNHMAKRKP